MSRQTLRQRQALRSAQPPVIPARYQHREVSGWAVLGVVALLLSVGFIAGAVA